MEYGLLIFLIFIALSLIVAARAAIKSKQKKQAPKKRYKPYQPYGQQESAVQTPARATTPRQAAAPPGQSESRAAYASADEFFRAGMYDRAKEEYLKTGRVFGAAKSIAAKGREFIPDALQVISRYAPEREEEMVRNLSRYFFDSGETEISALILSESGLTGEADAVLATIGKTIDDIALGEVVEVTSIEPATAEEDLVDTQKSLEELEVIAAETKETEEDEIIIKEKEKKEVEVKKITTQPLKIATSALEDRCSVCMSPIKAGESFVRCPYCEIPSHYSHIVEWIKVKPQCPNCRKKLVSKMFQE
jgi:hypothetical protein